MEDGDSMIDHLNVFNTMVSQLMYVYINMEKEDECITILCSLPNSCDNVVVAIGSSTNTTLKSEDVVASFLSQEMRRKYMENHRTNTLSMRLGCTKERGKSIGGRSRSRGRSKSPGDSFKKLCWK